jgi:hypothetical protein
LPEAPIAGGGVSLSGGETQADCERGGRLQGEKGRAPLSHRESLAMVAEQRDASGEEGQACLTHEEDRHAKVRGSATHRRD